MSFAFVGRNENLKDLKDLKVRLGVCVGARLLESNQTPQENHFLPSLHEPLHWGAERDPTAKMLSRQFFLQKGVSLAYVGRN